MDKIKAHSYVACSGWYEEQRAEQYLVLIGKDVVYCDDQPLWGDISRFGKPRYFVCGHLEGKPVGVLMLDHCSEAFNICSGRDLLAFEAEAIGTLYCHALPLVSSIRAHRFCGCCGNRCHKDTEDWAMVCRVCHHRQYPTVSPCIIAAVTRGQEILLVQHQRHRHRKAAMHTLIAGFIEPGERAEDAVIREVKEEVGIDVSCVVYQSSQSWPFSNALMLGFTANYTGGVLKLEEAEIYDAGWYRKDQLPLELLPTFTMSRQLIDAFINKDFVNVGRDRNEGES